MKPTLSISKARRESRPARILIAGPAGAGKTKSAIRIGAGLLGDGRMLFLDTERGSGKLYADDHDFDHADLPDFEPETYMMALDVAKEAGYEVVLIDSVSHLWQQILSTSKKMTGNSFANWGKLHDRVDAFTQKVLTYPGHIVLTTRAKMKYEQDESRKVVPMGLDPIMKDGFEYDVDAFFMIDTEHHATVRKTRFEWLADKIYTKPTEELGKQIRDWLAGGAEPIKKPEPKPEPKKEAPLQEALPWLRGDDELSAHLIVTECSKRGLPLAQLLDDDMDWLRKALTDSRVRNRLQPEDLSAINRFVELQKEQANG